MTRSSLPYRQAGHVALSLAIGSVGAALAVWASVPAPFLTGPATLVTVCALAGAPVFIPVWLRHTVFLIIGINMGAAITPAAVATAATWPGSVLALLVCVATIMWLGSMLMQRLAGMQPLAALLAATPGHLSFVLAISEDENTRDNRIVLIQSLRILVLTLAVPPVAQAINGAPLPTLPIMPTSMAQPILAATMVAAALLGFVFMRLKFPAALLLGGMAISAATHGTGLVHGGVPGWLSIPAFVTMGTLIGVRFNGITVSMLSQSMAAAVGLAVVAITIAVAFAIPVSLLTGLSIVTVVIAFAPGALEIMMAMSILMDANPAYVAAHHVLRITALSFFLPIGVAMVKKHYR